MAKLYLKPISSFFKEKRLVILGALPLITPAQSQAPSLKPFLSLRIGEVHKEETIARRRRAETPQLISD